MKLRWFAILVVLVMLGAVGSASAQMMGGGMGMHGGHGKGKGQGGMMAGEGKDHHFLQRDDRQGVGDRERRERIFHTPLFVGARA